MHALTRTDMIHPPLSRLLDGYSLEMTIKDGEALMRTAPNLVPGTSMAIAFLPGEALEDRIETARLVRELGFEPKVHLPARRIESEGQLATLLSRLASAAQMKQVLVIAGDTDRAAGPYADSLSVIETGLLETHGIDVVSIGGHPEGHPDMNRDDCWGWLERKIDAVGARGMAAHVVTQFAFDSDAMLGWLAEMRARGLRAPVALGVPGPAGIKRLLSFAARCGVGASASVLRKYGISLGQLLGSAGPDRLVDSIEAVFDPASHGPASLHFYPFGGLGKTAEWIAARGDA